MQICTSEIPTTWKSISPSENILSPMINLRIVGNLPIGAKGFPIMAKGKG